MYNIYIIPIFTFHYVSIKNDKEIEISRPTQIFTFHYVSIKTAEIIKKVYAKRIFTFHYVSIKTLSRESYLVTRELIYIPLCIY